MNLTDRRVHKIWGNAFDEGDVYVVEKDDAD
jgi:hypothetical protein